LIRALVAAGAIEEADAALAALPDAIAQDRGMAQALSALELAKTAKPVGDMAGLKAQVDADPKNHVLRCELAGGLLAAGDRDGAADALLHIIATDKDWNDGAARKQLLQMFEAIGLEDPWVSETRRRLSAILFG
jgi:putative thioredoxin